MFLYTMLHTVYLKDPLGQAIQQAEAKVNSKRGYPMRHVYLGEEVFLTA